MKSAARLASALALAAMLAGASGSVLADEPFPSHPVRIVTGSAAGGGVDVAARLMAETLSRAWGQSVIVENRPGASSTLAVDFVAKAKPDGYTVLFTSSTPMIQVKLVRAAPLPYDPVRDLEPLTLAGMGSMVIAALPDAPYKTLPEMVDYSRRSGKGLSFGSWGTGSGGHLVGEGVRVNAKANFIHVPYKGGEAAAFADLLGGSLDFTMMTQAFAKAQADAGKVRLLAVSSPQRDDSLPDIPTVKELGIPNVEVIGWIGTFAPAHTPPAVVDKLATAMRAALRDPAVMTRMAALGFNGGGLSPAEFKTLFQQDDARWTSLARSAGVKPE